MGRPAWTRAVAALLLGGAALAARAGTPPGQIARAVRELGDDRFAVREHASAFLWQAGRDAEPALRAALADHDLEVVRRANALLEKFRWGIYPDTPPEVVALIRRYQGEADEKAKQRIVQELLENTKAGYAAVTHIATAEPDRRLRQQVFRLQAHKAALELPALLAAGKVAPAEERLDLLVAADMPGAERDYAAFHLLRGTLDARIARCRELAAGSQGARAAETLAYLYRARGDLAAAQRAAEQAGRTDLARALLFEQGAWKALLAAGPEDQGVRAAFQRLAGDAAGFDTSMAELLRQARGAATSGDAWLVAKRLLLNDRPREGIEVLRREPLAAYDLLCAQFRFREALALAEEATARGDGTSLSLGIRRARTLALLGEKEESARRFGELAGRCEEAPALAELAQAEWVARHKRTAWEHAGQALARGLDDHKAVELLGQLIPNKGPTAFIWWLGLHRVSEGDHPAAVLRRVRDVLAGKVVGKELEGLLDAMDRLIRDVPVGPSVHWRRALAEVCEERGMEARAQKYLEAAAAEAPSTESLLGLGDFLARKKRWGEAAGRYGQAWGLDRAQALPLYLQGHALREAGRRAEGAALMERASFLPLGNAVARAAFARALAARSLEDEAQRQWDLLLKTGAPDANEMNLARQHEARAALARKEYATAALREEQAMLTCLQPDTQFTEARAYLSVPHHIHTWRALALAAGGQVAGARAEIDRALAALPVEADLAIALVPVLDAGGRRKEADRLFDRQVRAHEELLAAYPRCAWGHNALAWMAACCRRRLDLGLAHAEKALALAPDEPSYLDTLAEVYFQRGDGKHAIEYMKKCVALDPGRAYYRQQLRRLEKGDRAAPVPDSD